MLDANEQAKIASDNAERVRRSYPTRFVRVEPCPILPSAVYVVKNGKRLLMPVSQAIEFMREAMRAERVARWRAIHGAGPYVPSKRRKRLA